MFSLMECKVSEMLSFKSTDFSFGIRFWQRQDPPPYFSTFLAGPNKKITAPKSVMYR